MPDLIKETAQDAIDKFDAMKAAASRAIPAEQYEDAQAEFADAMARLRAALNSAS